MTTSRFSFTMLLTLACVTASFGQQFSTRSGDRQKAAEAAFAACKVCGVQHSHRVLGATAHNTVAIGSANPAYIALKTNTGEFTSKGSPLTVEADVLQPGDGSATYYLYGRKFKTDIYGNYQFAGYLLTGISRMPLNSGDTYLMYNGTAAEDEVGTQYYFEALLTKGDNYDTVQVVSTDVVVGQYFNSTRDVYHLDYITQQNGVTILHGSFPVGAVLFLNEGEYYGTGTFNMQVSSSDGVTVSFPTIYPDGSLQYPMSFDLWILAPSIGKTFTLPKAVFTQGAVQSPVSQ